MTAFSPSASWVNPMASGDAHASCRASVNARSSPSSSDRSMVWTAADEHFDAARHRTERRTTVAASRHRNRLALDKPGDLIPPTAPTSRRRTSVAAGQFRAPGREATGWLQSITQLAGGGSRPCCPQSPSISIERLPRSVAVPGAFIGSGSTRSAAPVRQLALENLNFCEEIRFLLGGVNPRIACPDLRHRQPPNQPLTHA